MTPLYLIHRLLSRLRLFADHWYVGGFYFFYSQTVFVLGRLDRTIALRITLRNLTEPLYQDRSFIGYLLGFIFRSLRSLVGFLLYAILTLLAVSLYIIWASIPLFVLVKIFSSLPGGVRQF